MASGTHPAKINLSTLPLLPAPGLYTSHISVNDRQSNCLLVSAPSEPRNLDKLEIKTHLPLRVLLPGKLSTMAFSLIKESSTKSCSLAY